MARLAVEDVRFGYAEREVLAGASLEVTSGEFVAIVGPNGAGKTTLLRLAAGLLAPASGRVTLDGQDVRAAPRRALARRLSGVAAAEDAAFPFTVRETVALGRHPWRSAFGPLTAEDRRHVDEAIEAADLRGLEDRALPALSTGERQRAAAARCLAQDADVLLLDEPTAHLDLGHQLRILRTLRDAAKRRGKAVLAALHDLNLAALVADRVAVLREGRIVADGPPKAVLTAALVREAFGAEVEVLDHPRTGAPVIAPLPPESA
jgi:iron complex transport system ATP-binding protein